MNVTEIYSRSIVQHDNATIMGVWRRYAACIPVERSTCNVGLMLHRGYVGPTESVCVPDTINTTEYLDTWMDALEERDRNPNLRMPL